MKLRVLGLVIAVSSLAPHADAASSGALSLTAARPSTAVVLLGKGQHVVTDENPFDGPKDVHIVTKAHWYAVALRDAAGQPQFLLLKSPRFADPFVFLPWDSGGIGPGKYTLTVAGDAPVSVTLDVTGGTRRTALQGRPSFAVYRDADLSSPVPVAADGSVSVAFSQPALVLAATGADDELGQVNEQRVCVARSGSTCSDGGFTFISPGATGGYNASAAIYPRLEPGSWDAVSTQREVGLLKDPYVLALALG